MSPNPTNLIEQQRSKTDFDIDLMNLFFEGSKANAEEVQQLMQEIERDPILKVDSNYYEYSIEEHRLITAQKIARLATLMERDEPDYELFQRRLNLVAIIDPQTTTRLGVHLGLFLTSIRGNGTDAQFKYWAFERGAILVKDVYGCFAMTELAHGSNVAGLETLLTFDEAKNQFVIHTPHIGATKWWIGGALHSANHSVVYARLIVRGKDYGVKTFVVPIRDADHNLLPGVSIGDIGAKMGRDGIDNGWIQFTNVRIPKEYMLSKFAKIEDNGEVIIPPLEQISYGALLGGRVTMVNDSFRMGSRIVTIALRYAVGRKQFGTKGSKGENQLISYPLHQSRLIPLLAFVYAGLAASQRLSKDHFSTQAKLEKLARSQDLQSIGSAIESLKNVFGSSLALKSTCTWFCANLIDECRQSCGGHGYSAYAGFAKLYADWVVQCTWEGDNNVLAMNGGRVVIQALQQLSKGKKVKGDLLYINNYKKYFDNSTKFNIDNLDQLLDAYKLVIIRASHHVLKSLPSNNNDWDVFGVEKVVISKLTATHYMLESLIHKINELSGDGNIKPSLIQLAKVFALSQIEKFNGTFLQFNVFQNDQVPEIASALKKLNYELHFKVIGLTDSFKLSDFFINSPLGSYSGDIYNNYFGIVKLQNDMSNDKLPYNDAFMALLNRDDVDTRHKHETSKLVLNKLRGDGKL